MSCGEKKAKDTEENNKEISQKQQKVNLKDESAEKVKSANDWEHVDLGDSDRKNKFLRLMGASKKEHHGKIIIGDKKPTHGRSKEETEKLSEDLEEQYKQGLEMKLSGHARKHVGLGFQDNHDEDEGGDHEDGRNSGKRADNGKDEDGFIERKKFKSDKYSKEATAAKDAEDKEKNKETKKSEVKKFGLFVKSSDS